MFTPDAAKQNHILAALPAAVYRRLLPRLRPVTLSLGRTLIPVHGNLRYVYFPTTSIVSLTYGVEQGVMAKAWPAGNEGIVGISAFLGGTAAGNQAEVEIAGEAFQLDAQTLRAEFRRGEELQKLLLRYVEALITQARSASAKAPKSTKPRGRCSAWARSICCPPTRCILHGPVPRERPSRSTV